MAEGRLERALRPRYVFATLGLLLVLAVLSVPEAANDDMTLRLTTKGANDWNAKGLYDVLALLGVRVTQRETPLRAPLDSDAVYALLIPPEEPTPREMGALMDAVRRGAGLIVIPRRGTTVAESLGIERSDAIDRAMRPASDTLFGRMHADSAEKEDFAQRMMRERRDSLRELDQDSATGDSTSRARRPERANTDRTTTVFDIPTSEGARTIHRYLRPTVAGDSDSTRVFPADTATLLSARLARVHPAIMGREIGRGRVLLIADPTFLRNGVLRRGDGAVLAERLFEWVDPGLAKPVVFDEYHQGYGDHPDMLGTVFHGLRSTAPGRATLQVVAAALLLLLASMVRPILPVTRTVIERRSPLEHVGALSRAYSRIGATRLAARRMVRGLRRRHPLGATRALDDARYLELLTERADALAADVALLQRAITVPLPAGEFVRAGAAIDHIERTLTS